MLNLVLTTDKLSVITGQSGDLDVHASWVDTDNTVTSSSNMTQGKTNTNITTATTTDIVPVPGASTSRNVKWISLRNAHASTAMDVTVQYNASGTLYELMKCTLLAQEELVCREGIWFHFDTSGGVYGSAVVSAPLTVATLASDVTNATTTAAKITNMDRVVAPGTYSFIYNLLYRSDTTTTGIKFSVNHTGTLTFFVANMRYVDVNTLNSAGAASQAANASTAQIMGAYSFRAKSATASFGPTLSVDTINVDMLMIIEGLMVVTVSGNIELWHASEVATTTTVKAGTNLVLIKTG